MAKFAILGQFGDDSGKDNEYVAQWSFEKNGWFLMASFNDSQFKTGDHATAKAAFAKAQQTNTPIDGRALKKVWIHHFDKK
jgi:hypothetical protein